MTQPGLYNAMVTDIKETLDEVFEDFPQIPDRLVCEAAERVMKQRLGPRSSTSARRTATPPKRGRTAAG